MENESSHKIDWLFNNHKTIYKKSWFKTIQVKLTSRPNANEQMNVMENGMRSSPRIRKNSSEI